MTTITIQISDEGFTASLQRLLERGGDTSTLTFLIGQGIEERIDARFASSTGPDGQRWKDNRPVTLAREALRLSLFKSNFMGPQKGRRPSKRGTERLAAKQPLIGETGTLRDQIAALPDSAGVTVTAGATVYAAIQQFGGTRAEFSHLWGDIPARPFMPVTPDGDLYPTEAEAIMADLNDFFAGLA
jgi:phage gpG-like protein